MKKSDVIAYYLEKKCHGDKSKVILAIAKELNCTYQNVWQMPEILPEGTAYKLHVKTNRELEL